MKTENDLSILRRWEDGETVSSITMGLRRLAQIVKEEAHRRFDEGKFF